MPTKTPQNLFDYEALAQAKLHPALWDYIAAGAADEVTLAENRRAFDRIFLKPRMLVDMNAIDTKVSVLGTPMAAPIMIAPTGVHGALCADGECATAKAAARAGIAMVAASSSNRTIEQIAAAAAAHLWLQLYLLPEREWTLALVRRAEAAGCRAIMLTVDSPRFGRKDRSLRTQADFPWPDRDNMKGVPPAIVQASQTGAPATWDDVDWLRAVTKLPIVLKGILTAEDAALAASHGVAAIAVSNHGGRQLDGAIASIEALPDIVAAAGGRCEIYLDGGIRRGTDVLKALALGARAVMIGRPVLWGLAVGGARGAFAVLEMLKSELVAAMALSGRPTLASIDSSLLRLPDS